MSYTSFSFFLFVLITVIVYYAINKKWQKFIILIANIIFYFSFNPICFAYILISTITTYFGGICIGKYYDCERKESINCISIEEKKAIKSKYNSKAKKVLIISLTIIIGILVICKYTNFVIGNINRVLLTNIESINILVPIGVSYYTFMAISYLLDVYWKRIEKEDNFVFFASYLSYFPHIIEGPIDRYKEFKEQIKDGVKLKYKNIIYGLELALWGLFKKLVIADRISPFVNEIYGNWNEHDACMLIIASVLYAFQIYADFSGCMDIVGGVSELFGIELKKNFNHPFFSETVAEYWRRWHISLGDWFKDYLYIPIYKSRLLKKIRTKYKNSKPRLCEIITTSIPTLVIWFTTGLWHGASWSYIAWGLYFGIIMIISNIFNPLLEKVNSFLHIKTDKFSWKLFRIIRTFFLTCLGRIFTITTSFTVGLKLINKSFTTIGFWELVNGGLFDHGINRRNFNVLIISITILFIVDLLQEKIKIRDYLEKENLIFRWILVFGCLFSIIIFGIYGPGYDAAAFIYANF